ncbi:hypothetical protein GXW82_10415 [Streptacidiphilus sp. 4-A2]|nr:hypothetical protein [Streptacidiphilus sp. 4-A2]
MLVMQNNDGAQLELPGLACSAEPIGLRVAKFDLTMGLRECFGADGEPAGIEGSVEYATALFDTATVDLLTERLVRLLAAAVADPQAPSGAWTCSARTSGTRRCTAGTTPRPRSPAARCRSCSSGRWH